MNNIKLAELCKSIKQVGENDTSVFLHLNSVSDSLRKQFRFVAKLNRQFHTVAFHSGETWYVF